jgi:hypothetical protein
MHYTTPDGPLGVSSRRGYVRPSGRRRAFISFRGASRGGVYLLPPKKFPDSRVMVSCRRCRPVAPFFGTPGERTGLFVCVEPPSRWGRGIWGAAFFSARSCARRLAVPPALRRKDAGARTREEELTTLLRRRIGTDDFTLLRKNRGNCNWPALRGQTHGLARLPLESDETQAHAYPRGVRSEKTVVCRDGNAYDGNNDGWARLAGERDRRAAASRQDLAPRAPLASRARTDAVTPRWSPT